MTGLRIAPSLQLPIDVAGEAIAILAKRGAGKTNTATVVVEELYRAGVQIVILDPVGSWWGIRSSADGQGKGLEIPILGGQYGDVPLEPTAGALVADVVVDNGASLLIDLSDFPSKSAHARFVVDFAERLFRRKARDRTLVHLVLEEADAFAPQTKAADVARMKGAIEQIVRRGRSRGLGITMITQRSAVLDKDVLEQTDVLVVMRTTGPNDRKAIERWLAAGHDTDGADEALASLSGLETGEAWVFNPERSLLKRVHVRRRETFDSSSTPKAGEARPEPRDVAPIDVAKLGEQIAATAERAAATDPKKLQARIHELERELARRPTETVTETVEVRVPVEIPVLSDELVARLEAEVEDLLQITEVVAPLRAVVDQIQEALRAAKGATDARADTRTATPVRRRIEATPRRDREPPQAHRVATRHPRTPEDSAGEDVRLKAGARRILETLARHHPMRVTRAQLGTLAKFKITGGTFGTYFSQLKRLGLLDESGGEISITDAGLDHLGEAPPAPQSTEELLEMWRGALKAGARAMLDTLVEAYPNALSREELADRVEMTMTGGTFGTYLGTLRRNGLVDIDGGEVRASDTLFMGSPV